jgi:hypothetical protein
MWRATFKDKVIRQHPEDRYSKYKPGAEYNPSSFRDFQEYFDKHPGELNKFELIGDNAVATVDLTRPWAPVIYLDEYGKYGSHKKTIIHKEKRPLKDVRIIYYRNTQATIVDGQMGEPSVQSYVLGYQGLDDSGNCRKKMISVI